MVVGFASLYCVRIFTCLVLSVCLNGALSGLKWKSAHCLKWSWSWFRHLVLVYSIKTAILYKDWSLSWCNDVCRCSCAVTYDGTYTPKHSTCTCVRMYMYEHILCVPHSYNIRGLRMWHSDTACDIVNMAVTIWLTAAAVSPSSADHVKK